MSEPPTVLPGDPPQRNAPAKNDEEPQLIPWWLSFVMAALVGIITFVVTITQRENLASSLAFAGVFAGVGFIITAVMWLMQRIARKRDFGEAAYRAFIFAVIFLFFVVGFIFAQDFRSASWLLLAFGAVLTVWLGTLAVASFAEWCGRHWGRVLSSILISLALVAFLAWFGGTSIVNMFRAAQGQFVPSLAEAVFGVLISLWLIIIFVLLLLLIRRWRPLNADSISFLLWWPAHFALHVPMFAALIIGLCIGGAFLGRLLSHPFLGAWLALILPLVGLWLLDRFERR
jgi:hypothetical protein